MQATVIPTIAFLAAHSMFGLAGGLAAALTWSWGCILWRSATGRSVGGLLPIGAIGLTFRSLVALVSGSTFVYFAGPAVVMTASGLVILASAWTSRPLIGRVVTDVVPLPDSVLEHPRTDRLMRHLSALWGLEQVVCAAVNVYLLTELPTDRYLVVRAPAAWTLSAAALAISLSAGRRHLAAIGAMPQPVPLLPAESRGELIAVAAA